MYHFSFVQFLARLPDQISHPLVRQNADYPSPPLLTPSCDSHEPHALESPATAEAEYARVLDLQECLRVEEVTTEMQMDVGQLFLDPPRYRASDDHLRDVRVLIGRACLGLSYILDECSTRGLGLGLNVESIDACRVPHRPLSHPYSMIFCVSSAFSPEQQKNPPVALLETRIGL